MGGFGPKSQRPDLLGDLWSFCCWSGCETGQGGGGESSSPLRKEGGGVETGFEPVIYCSLPPHN